MKRKISCVCIIIMLFLINIISLPVFGLKTNIITNYGQTITVDDNGNADYTKIQDAIDAANNGDTVYVYNGMYYESLVVDKAIILTGQNRKYTIIDAQNASYAIKLTVDNIKINGFTVQNAYWDDIHFKYSNNSQIFNNIIQNTNRYNGICVRDMCDNTKIYNNIVRNCKDIGIELNSNNNEVYDNTVSNNGWCGIYNWDSPTAVNKNFIFDNTIEGNYYGIVLSEINEVYGNILRSNTEGAILVGSSNNKIHDNDIIDNIGDGIIIEYPENNEIYSNKFYNNYNGVKIMMFTSNNKIYGNTFEKNYRGVYIERMCSGNIIYHNNFLSNSHQHALDSKANTNIWNTSTGGNYWDDYKDNHPDAKPSEDGKTWDTEYSITFDSYDFYPLINKVGKSKIKSFSLNFPNVLIRLLEYFPLLQNFLKI